MPTFLAFHVSEQANNDAKRAYIVVFSLQLVDIHYRDLGPLCQFIDQDWREMSTRGSRIRISGKPFLNSHS